MFFRLLIESFARQKRRKALAGVAILLGATAVTAMLALATSIGDRIHRELSVYGANIVVTPKAANLDVKIAGIDLKPDTGGAYLDEMNLEKLKGIFWSNNITGVSPELSFRIIASSKNVNVEAESVGVWFKQRFGTIAQTGAPQLHPYWRIAGIWPEDDISDMWVKGRSFSLPGQIVVGKTLAEKLGVHVNDEIHLEEAPPHSQSTFIADQIFRITAILSSGDETDNKVLMPLKLAQTIFANSSIDPRTFNFRDISRVEISARTRPEDAFARMDPDKLSAKQHDIWYCRPYANSIAYQIMEAIPGAQAEQVRQVEQTEGTLLSRISGLMWLISAAALLAAGFAVSAAMATAVLERRGEIGLMRSLGASKAAIATLFYAESGLLAVVAGTFGYLGGSALAFWLGRRIFSADGASPLLIPVLLPVVVAMAVVVAVLGSTPSIRAALRIDPAATLRGGE